MLLYGEDSCYQPTDGLQPQGPSASIAFNPESVPVLRLRDLQRAGTLAER
jgi:hypothetical protein